MADSDVSATTTSGNKKKSASCINDVLPLSTATAKLGPSEADSSLHCNARKRGNKRKRNRNHQNSNYKNSCSASSITIQPTKRGTSMTAAAPTAQDLAHSKHVKRLFNDLIVAISTLESSSSSTTSTTTTHQEEMEIQTKKRQFDDDDDDDNDNDVNINTNINNNNAYQNYKSLQQTLQHHGATISPQVHKRVHYLLCTRSAMTHATQRVRQAFKRNVDIVDVAWVKECVETGTIVNVEKYLCNDKVACWIAEKEKEKKREAKRKVSDSTSSACGIDETGHDDGDIIGEENEDVGWSTPIELECCCVCHENGDDDCPWCRDCNLTLDRKKKAEK